MCKTCVQFVERVLNACANLSTYQRLFAPAVIAHVEISPVLHGESNFCSHRFTQQNIGASSLLLSELYPVSTKPIMTKKS